MGNSNIGAGIKGGRIIHRIDDDWKDSLGLESGFIDDLQPELGFPELIRSWP